VKFPREPFYSKKIKYLIEKCLEKNPEKRKTAEEIIKMCAVHKYDVLDKYKPIFKKRNYDINISNEEICMTLDFFHNECNAVFENPDDKSKPIILKFKKKLIRFELPKDRSLTKITIKENIHYVPIKPPIEKKSEGSSKTITTHIITTTSDDPMKSFTVKKTIVLEVDNNNRNSVKVTKHITTNGNGDKEVEDLEMEKKIMDDLQKIGNKDGKAVIQKYIAEK
jgi:serine/threonine protein kinase